MLNLKFPFLLFLFSFLSSLFLALHFLKGCIQILMWTFIGLSSIYVKKVHTHEIITMNRVYLKATTISGYKF